MNTSFYLAVYLKKKKKSYHFYVESIQLKESHLGSSFEKYIALSFPSCKQLLALGMIELFKASLKELPAQKAPV